MPDIRAIALASGSKGNSLYIEGGGVRILIDAGLSCRQIETRLRETGVEPADIDAILVTHEHTDHISAIPVFSRKHKTKIYVTAKTASSGISRIRLVEHLPAERMVNIEAGVKFNIGDLTIHPFSISHDVADPVAYRVETKGAALGLVTDLGVVTRLVCDRLTDCQALFCESNHDPTMLREGPYPWAIKKRIAGKKGHLANSDTRMLIENIYHQDLETIVLSHLSEQNNTPRLAYDHTYEFLKKIDSKTKLKVAFQDKVGTPVEIG